MDTLIRRKGFDIPAMKFDLPPLFEGQHVILKSGMVRADSREVPMKGSYRVAQVKIVLDPDKNLCQQEVILEALI